MPAGGPRARTLAPPDDREEAMQGEAMERSGSGQGLGRRETLVLVGLLLASDRVRAQAMGRAGRPHRAGTIPTGKGVRFTWK